MAYLCVVLMCRVCGLEFRGQREQIGDAGGEAACESYPISWSVFAKQQALGVGRAGKAGQGKQGWGT
jgi:hypothetical protein